MASKTVIRPIDLSFTDSNVVNSKRSVRLRHPIKNSESHRNWVDWSLTRKSISENRIDWETKWLSLKGGRLRKVVAKESGSRLE